MIRILRIVLIGFYLIAGLNHFIMPEFYYGLIPDYLPYHGVINYVSGVAEIVLALGVANKGTRSVAVKGLILLLILFIPAHVYFIQVGSCVEGALCVSPWIAWLRLLVIHPLLIIWALAIRKTN